MDKYANENTIIKNDMYDLFKDYIICPACNSLMIEPFMCIFCQTTFCKHCKEKNGCPKRCNNPIIKEVIEKNNYIKKFKFKCINGCGEEILFDDINKHYSSNCATIKTKLKPMGSLEYNDYKNNSGRESINIPNLSSMSYILLFF